VVPFSHWLENCTFGLVLWRVAQERAKWRNQIRRQPPAAGMVMGTLAAGRRQRQKIGNYVMVHSPFCGKGVC